MGVGVALGQVVAARTVHTPPVRVCWMAPRAAAIESGPAVRTSGTTATVASGATPRAGAAVDRAVVVGPGVRPSSWRSSGTPGEPCAPGAPAASEPCPSGPGSSAHDGGPAGSSRAGGSGGSERCGSAGLAGRVTCGVPSACAPGSTMVSMRQSEPTTSIAAWRTISPLPPFSNDSRPRSWRSRG